MTDKNQRGELSQDPASLVLAHVLPVRLMRATLVSTAAAIVVALLYLLGTDSRSTTSYLFAIFVTGGVISAFAGYLASILPRENSGHTLPAGWKRISDLTALSIPGSLTVLLAFGTYLTYGAAPYIAPTVTLGRTLSLLYLPLIATIATLHSIWTKCILWIFAGATYVFAIFLTKTQDQGFVIAIHLALYVATAVVINALASSVMREILKRSEAQELTDERVHLWNDVAVRAHSISTLATSNDILGGVVDATVALGYEIVSICVLNLANRTYRYSHPHGIPEAFLEVDLPLQGISALVLSKRDTVIFNYSDFPNGLPAFKELGLRTTVGVPLWNGGEITAVLAAGSTSERRISGEELTALELLATAGSSALEHQALTSVLMANVTQLHSMLENSPSATIVIDDSRTIILANRRADLLFGYDRQTLVDKSLEDIVVNADQIYTFLDSTSDDNDLKPFRTVIICSDQLEVEVEVSASRLSISDKKLVSLAFRDITEQKRFEARLLDRVNYDEHTGLASRQKLIDDLRKAVARNARARTPVTLVVFELDRYSYLNESLKTPDREKVIREILTRLDNYIRDSDTLARIGDDKFALLAEDLSEANSLDYVRRLLACATDTIYLGENRIQSNASFGVAFASPGVSADTLLQYANSAMLRAKKTGGSNIAFFDEQIIAAATERLEIESDLRDALRLRHFSLAYQPIMDLTDNKVTAAEALIRWNHSERGPIPPNFFIPIAEETGIIVPMGTWVLREACRQLKQWDEHQLAGNQLSISVNVSRYQLQSNQILIDLSSALEDFKIQPNRLTIEITETALLKDAESAFKVIRELAELGIKLAIDDFGTGYSSLSMLTSLPVDVLKIDKSFVDQIGTKTDATIHAILNMSEELGLIVVAEGVEMQSQAERLLELGCHFAQGFLFSKPLNPSEAKDFIIGHS